MKTTYLRYSWQLLTVLLFQTGCVHLITISNDPTTKETSAMLHGDKRQHPFRKYTLGIKNTISKKIGNLNQEPRSKFPDNSFISNGPHLTVRCTPNKVYEGQSATLCCSSNSRLTTIDLWWDLNSLLLSSKHDTNVICHKIVNVSRYNSGGYRCYAENKFVILNAGVKLKVLYPPDIPDQHVQLTENNLSRNLHCLAHGVPEVFIYGQWEHVSFFDEHIRYLDSTIHGRVALPHIAKKINRYQDSGIYICTASNGVVDRSGNSFQNGTVYVIANGPPVFVEKIENKQYGNLGEIFKLKFVLYTKSEIIWYNVKSENQDIAASMEKTSVNGTIIFHGTEITVESIQVVLSFNISNNNSQIYTVTLCNGFGNNSFEAEIEIVTIGEKNTHGTNVAIIISLVILVMCFPISGAAVFLRRKRNRNGKRRIVDNIPESVEGFPVPVPVNHVQNNHAHSRDPLTNNADAVIQTCTSETGRINDAKSRTVYTDANDSAKAVHFIASQHVISSDGTGYSDVW